MNVRGKKQPGEEKQRRATQHTHTHTHTMLPLISVASANQGVPDDISQVFDTLVSQKR